ncbi:MAG: FAD-binding oxidoreductase [Candidatus Omnitrophica bacterium]|nr:FAD-binding oxidoreductase [Candidatus Omnitrophota bacterium]
MIIKRDDLQSYLEDTSNLKGSAELLYIPENTQEVAMAIGECVKENMAFTISAGRTGTTAGCVPLEGAIISLEKLKGIKIDKSNRRGCFQGGVSLQEASQEAARYGLSLRAASTEELAFVSGAVSTSASGVRGFGYGSIRKYVMSLDVVLSTKEQLTIKRGQFIARGRVFDFIHQGKHFNFTLPSYSMPTVKSQAGYFVCDNMDLIDLFIGSEGTLGVITSVELSLQDEPEDIFDSLIFFRSEKDAIAFADKIKLLKEKGEISPVSLEFFDGNSLDFLKPHYSFIPNKASGAIYFEQEGNDSAMEKLASWIEESNASIDESIIADSPRLRDKIFQFRHRLPQEINEFLRHSNQVKVAADIAVANENFMEMYDFYKNKAQDCGIHYLNFGHIGESHLHFNFLPKTDQQSAKAKELLKLFCQKAVALGGTVSAEHGIGKIKRDYLKIMYSDDEIKQMIKLKKYFDPNCLLGLDNLFEKELLTSIINGNV